MASSVEVPAGEEPPQIPAAVVDTLVAISGGHQETKKSSGNPRSNETSAILKLKGLPYSITEQHIRDFFKDFQVLSIRFVYEPDGRPSGLAFAEFESKDEAVKALSKNGEYIGERYVRLLHVPVTEMDEQVRLGTLAIPGNAAKLRSRLMRQQQQQQHNRLAYLTGPLQLVPTIIPSARPQLVNVGHAVNPQYAGNAQYNGNPQYAGIAGNPQYAGHGNTQYAGAMASQVPLDTRAWSTYTQAQASPAAMAAQFQNLSVGSGHQALNQGMLSGGHFMHQHQASLGPAVLQQAPAQVIHTARPMQPLNPASATVKVRGLPYRSSPAEILSFFQGYQYLPDSLQIGLDSLGRPSGEAWLSFVNPPEALRGVRDLNRRFMGTRYLELSLC